MNTTTKFLITALLAVLTSASIAQRYVTLHSGGVVTHYNENNVFEEAYNAANAAGGDTIYIPGGVFNPPKRIEKSLTILGVGFDPDSTAATNRTVINSSILLSEGVDTFYMEGVEVGGGLYYSWDDALVNKVELVRCKINGEISAQTDSFVDELFVRNCALIGDVRCGAANKTFLYNSIVQGRCYDAKNAIVKNCIFLFNRVSSASYWYTFDAAQNCTFTNNIFLARDVPIEIAADGGVYEKNIFIESGTIHGTIINNGNYIDVDESGIFVNQPNVSYSHEYDYHLQTPDTYLGDDGTQVGIYGGMFPWKEGAVPAAPHIRINNTASETTAEGMLQLDITVSAQGNAD